MLGALGHGCLSSIYIRGLQRIHVGVPRKHRTLDARDQVRSYLFFYSSRVARFSPQSHIAVIVDDVFCTLSANEHPLKADTDDKTRVTNARRMVQTCSPRGPRETVRALDLQRVRIKQHAIVWPKAATQAALAATRPSGLRGPP